MAIHTDITPVSISVHSGLCRGKLFPLSCTKVYILSSFCIILSVGNAGGQGTGLVNYE